MAVMYCTADNVYDALEGISTNEISQARVEDRIAYARSIIDGKVAKRYDVPFGSSPYPPLAVQLNVDLASYFVMKTLYIGEGQNRSSWTRSFYENAMVILDEIADGGIDLLDDNGVLISERDSSTRVRSNTENYKPTFGFGDALDEEIDPDRINDETDGNLAG